MKADYPYETTSMQTYLLHNQQKELYDYLFMRYYSLNSQSDSPINSSSHYYPQLISSLYSSLSYSSILDLCLQSQLVASMKDNNNYDKEIHQAKRIILAQVLVKDYVKVFMSQQHRQVSIEQAIFRIVVQKSVISIADSVIYYQGLNDTSNQITQIFNLVGPQLNFLILSIAIDKKISIEQTPIQELFHKIKDSIHQIIVELNLNNHIKSTTISIINQYLQHCFNIQNLRQEQKLTQLFIIQFERFKCKYQTCETDEKTHHILQLHYVKQLLQGQTHGCLLNSQNYNQNPLNSLHTSLNTRMINFYNHFHQLQGHRSLTHINQQLLKSFVKQPYQTALFVLYKLLSQCGLKNIDRIFTKNQSDFRDYVLVNPLTFLLIDPQRLTRQNAESLSMSLWIVMSVWTQNSNKNPFPYNKAPKNPQRQLEPDQQPLYSTQTTLANSDPRQIFRIKRQSYPTTLPPNPTQLLNQQHLNQAKTQNTKTNSREQKQDYVSGLKTTMIMFLLGLAVETTMLKYYPIQQNHISELLQVEIFSGLLLDSPFALKTISSTIKQRAIANIVNEEQSPYEQELLDKIDNAQTIEQIEYLQKLLNQKNQRSNHLKAMKPSFYSQSSLSLPTFEPQHNQWFLPWMCLIQDKQKFNTLRKHPRSIELGLKLAQKRPHTLFKIYSYELLALVYEFNKQQHFRQDKGKLHKEKIDNGYKFRGNRNVPMKKSIEYVRSQAKSNSLSGNMFGNNGSLGNKIVNMKKLTLQERIAEVKMVRRIFELHKGSGIDQNILSQCESSLQNIQRQLLSL